MSYSPELMWECVKKNSSFIRKSTNMPVMSADPNNLSGMNSFKFSGLCGNALGLNSKKNGKNEKILLVKSHPKASRAARPPSMDLKVGLSKGTKKAVGAIDKALAGKYYRRDLADLVKAKYTKIKTSFKKKKVVVKSRRAPKS